MRYFTLSFHAQYSFVIGASIFQCSSADSTNLITIKFYIFFYCLVTENLQYLRLGDNNIHVIPSEALRPLHRLRHLDLRSNNISAIAEDAFVGYGDSITFLNLQKNE